MNLLRYKTVTGERRCTQHSAALILWLFSFVVCSCAAKPGNVVYPSTTGTPVYKLQIRLLPDRPRLEVSGTIQLPAADAPRSSIELSLSELMNDFNVDVVSPKVSLGAVKLDQTHRPEWRSGWGVIKWKITPAQPFPANEPVVLRFSYARETSGSSNVFGLSKEVSFAAGINTAWYPQLPDVRGTGLLDFSVPSGYTVYATGAGQKETGQGVFRFEVNNPAFFTFAVARYSVKKKDGPIQIALYTLRPHDSAKQFLEGTARVLKVLVDEFGDYPFSEFAIVEIPVSQADRAGFEGASMEGCIFVNSDYIEKGFNTAFFGHEIGHQWWGNLIASKSVEGRWMLAESMAQFGSMRAVEILEGEAAATQYRRTGYPGYISDQSARGYFELVSKGQDHPLLNLSANNNQTRVIADSKGAIVWDMLARMLGRDVFSRSLRNLIKECKYQQVSWDQFVRAVEADSGQDIKWFVAQWIEKTGAPDYSLTWKQEGETLRGTVSQTAPYFRADLEIEIQGAGSKVVKVVQISKEQASFEWTVPFRVETVTLDPHYRVLRWTPEFRARQDN
ncbi:MAG TPA: M1 family aminopeptidase [Pyrinomonadaceae bacterium]|nr:M1 family aminopeptidase [Pyrinomonadaceae bacterium]